ncbi:hypothetical protein D3C84_977980 [compost metagenome]
MVTPPPPKMPPTIIAGPMLLMKYVIAPDTKPTIAPANEVICIITSLSWSSLLLWWQCGQTFPEKGMVSPQLEQIIFILWVNPFLLKLRWELLKSND